MIRRTTATVALLAFTNYIFSCYSNEFISAGDVKLTKETILQLVLRDGTIVKFNDSGGKYVGEQKVVAGITSTGDTIEVEVDNILSAEVRKMDVAMAAMTVKPKMRGYLKFILSYL